MEMFEVILYDYLPVYDCKHQFFESAIHDNLG